MRRSDSTRAARAGEPRRGWQEDLYLVIFEAETLAGKWFDVLLIVSILLSILVVMLDSVQSVRARHGTAFWVLEWLFTLIFTVEYALRVVCSRRPRRYVVSFFGLVDLLAILPTYVSLLFPASKYLVVIRILRILRIFRVLKLVQYVGESNHLMRALWASRRKVTVFLFAVMTIVVIFGSLIYVVEGEQNGFTSIPKSVYWAVVTMTTVGYGDISPRTNLGQIIASVIMILGYAIIAVPTGIVTAEMVKGHEAPTPRACPGCGTVGHDLDAVHCKHCGGLLHAAEKAH